MNSGEILLIALFSVPCIILIFMCILKIHTINNIPDSELEELIVKK